MKNNIRKPKIALLMAFLSIGAGTALAQYDAMFTQYMFNEMYINPAYAGSKEAMSVTALHRQQWVNFPGRPITSSFSLHGPLMNNKMGLGISALNEKIGALNRNLIYLSYAYRVKTGKNGTLAFGLMGGIHNQVNKVSSLNASNDGSIDPRLGQNNISLLSPNFGAGIYFSNKTFYTGISIPRMIDDNAILNADGEITSSSFRASSFHYYYTIGNVFTLNSDLKLKVQALVQAVQNAPVLINLNANFLIKEMVWLGASYRSTSEISAIVGVQINPQFLVSYSYDYGLNNIQKYSQGSHEIVLSYLFSYKLKKLATPRYF